MVEFKQDKQVLDKSEQDKRPDPEVFIQEADLQSTAKGDKPGDMPPHPLAVRHGSGGSFVSLGGGWLLPAHVQQPTKAGDTK